MLEQAGWDAQLTLRFAARGERTELVERTHHGPLRVQRPFYPEASGTPHVYVLHPPGGVVGGDTLGLTVEVSAGARALLTTPAATKLYRSAGPRSRVQQTLRVRRGACLEWLPQETIAFSAANAGLETHIELEAGARFLGWEILCLGRPASGERFDRGEVAQRIELRSEGKLAYRESGRYRGDGAVMGAAWGLAGQPVTGTFVCAGLALGPHLEQLRAALQGVSALAAVSCMGELTVARYLGPKTEEARACFARVWEVVRPLVVGQRADAPRIWAT